MTVVARHPILEVRDGFIICGGVQRTAALKLEPGHDPPAVGETHQMLRPIFHDAEYQRSSLAEVSVGDVIEEHLDGTRVHVPRARPVGQ